MNDAEKSGAASQRDRDDIAAKTNEVKQEHRRKLANYKAEYDKKVQVANDTLSKDLSSLENQAKIADANVESHEMYTKQFHSYLEFTQKKADLASGMMWSKRNMPYAHISLSEIIDDLELSGGEAAVHSLTGEKVIQKLNKMDNMGYQFGETWKELRKSAEFVAMYPYDTIKTNNNESVDTLRARLIDYLMCLGNAPGSLQSPKIAPDAGFQIGTYVGKKRQQERRKEIRRRSYSTEVQGQTVGLSAAELLEELPGDMAAVVAKAVSSASAKKRRRSASTAAAAAGAAAAAPLEE